jgi:hypothetical protein
VTTRRRVVRVEDLIGRRVHDRSGGIVGRIEEIRVEHRGGCYQVREYHLGTGALFERLAIVRRVFGRDAATLVARWDQLDIRQPDRPVLTCGREELTREPNHVTSSP